MTLSQLKQAIEDVSPIPKAGYSPGDIIRHHATRAYAWQIAFEWHAALGNRHAGDLAKGLDELEQGMRLIAEKLR